MSSPQIDRRIFVVGVPRSGTTLVQSLLAAHSRVASFTESHFFSRHFRSLPRWSTAVLTRDPAPRLHEFLLENGVETARAASMEESLRRAVPSRWFRPLRTRSVACRLLEVLDELALQQGRSSWVEKTPMHLCFVPFLAGLAGSGQHTLFVHVVRDGTQVVPSLLEASRGWERPYDLATCVRRWNEDVAFSLSRASAVDDRFVFYEDLTSRPEATLRRLLGDLDLEWEPEILQRYAATARRLITGEEPWKNIGDEVRRPETSRHGLSEEHRKQVAATLRSDLYAKLHCLTSGQQRLTER